jgi:hypothetical protein
VPLTENQLKALKPKNKPYKVTDDRGLYVEVSPTRCTSDPTSLLKGALITPKPKHYAAILDPKELGGLLRAINDYTGYPITKYALLIAPHVGAGSRRTAWPMRANIAARTPGASSMSR